MMSTTQRIPHKMHSYIVILHRNLLLLELPPFLRNHSHIKRPKIFPALPVGAFPLAFRHSIHRATRSTPCSLLIVSQSPSLATIINAACPSSNFVVVTTGSAVMYGAVLNLPSYGLYGSPLNLRFTSARRLAVHFQCPSPNARLHIRPSTRPFLTKPSSPGCSASIRAISEAELPVWSSESAIVSHPVVVWWPRTALLSPVHATRTVRFARS